MATTCGLKTSSASSAARCPPRLRREGVDWWPAEEISHGQAHRVIDAGPADVMVCHDCPAGVPLDLPPAPLLWQSELGRATEHRRRLRVVVDRVRPAYLLHGHY